MSVFASEFAFMAGIPVGSAWGAAGEAFPYESSLSDCCCVEETYPSLYSTAGMDSPAVRLTVLFPDGSVLV